MNLRRSPIPMLAATLTASALMLAGCGGDAKDDSAPKISSTPTITQQPSPIESSAPTAPSGKLPALFDRPKGEFCKLFQSEISAITGVEVTNPVETSDPGHSVLCVWDQGGKLVAKVEASNTMGVSDLKAMYGADPTMKGKFNDCTIADKPGVCATPNGSEPMAAVEHDGGYLLSAYSPDAEKAKQLAEYALSVAK